MYIAIDVGSTTIRIACFASKALPVIESLDTIKNSGDFDKDLANIQGIIFELTKNKGINGIGICVPGILNENKEIIALASNIPHWVNKPIKQILEKKYRTIVAMDNDAIAATKAEAMFGNYNSSKFLFVQWGTGVGGSYVFKDSQTDNFHILPSELGHQIIKFEGEQCGCGQKGCLELYVSGGNFVKRYGKIAKNLTELDWDIILKTMAHGLVNALNIYEVPLIVLGGTVSIEQTARIPSLQTLVQQYFRGPQKVNVILSMLGKDSGIIGAFSLLK